jgi:hypothetical protein
MPLASFKLAELQAVIKDIANRTIQHSPSVVNFMVYEDDCDIGGMRVVVDWLKTLRLPISPNYKGVKDLPVLPNYTIKQAIILHEVADFLGFQTPLSYRGLRDALYAYLNKACPTPAAMVELWARTSADRDDHLRRKAINAALTYVKAKDGAGANGTVNIAYITAFQAHAELLKAFNNRRDEYLAFQDRVVARQEREEARQVRFAENQSRRQAEYEGKKAAEKKKREYEVERINRRVVTTIKRDD